MHVLDTDVAVDFLRKDDKTVEFLERENKVGITTISIAELSHGLNKGGKTRKNVKSFFDFLLGLDFLEFNVLDGLLFGKLKNKLEENGRICSDFDIAIASICLTNNATLVTRNIKHYEHFEDLKILKI